ncbi:MAG: proton-conducting transporter membrane subunit [Actinomycetota bacterium]|jgi:hydrogenase-4 component F|nr:proton-conducting transporter membrane subunit [Actinomycetota bacterium]
MTASSVLVAIVIVPFVVSVATFFLPVRMSKPLTVVTGIAIFALSAALVPRVLRAPIRVGGTLQADALSVVFLVATAFLYATTAIFAAGYLHLEAGRSGARYGRLFYSGINLFCWAMVVAPVVNGIALLWVAIEITTVVSALLVAIDDTEAASEAAWKYVLLASLGLGIALLATIVMYYAGTATFGPAYNLSYAKLLAGAHHFPPAAVRLAFVLAVLGFGTKMGLVPVHTWLPDAHSEAPTPVSALLSAALLAICFYAILRFYQITERAVGSTYPRDVLLVFGVASLLLAALYLLRQRDVKRLLAYSSVEHMGILAIGMSFGVQLATIGVLLHVLSHAAAKGTAFFGSGSIVRKFGTKDMRRIRGGVGVLPWSGPLMVAAILALSAMPPFGIFRSEFLIVSGGLSDPHDAGAAILVVLVTIAFFGLSWFTSQTMLSPDPRPGGAPDQVVGAPDQVVVTRGEPSVWIVVAMVIGLGALLVLGVHLPSQLSQLLDQAARELGGPR